jgi:hypothetical protein
MIPMKCGATGPCGAFGSSSKNRTKPGLLAVAALGAVLFASFTHHLAGPTTAQANEALNAVMSGQHGPNEATIAAFQRALGATMLAAAGCAAFAGLAAWLWIESDGAHSTKLRQ